MQTVAITMPTSQTEGTQSFVARWLKNAGDAVTEHEPLLEISTDKAIMELPSPATGILEEVLKRENDQIEPGDILGRIKPQSVEAAQSQPAATQNGVADTPQPAAHNELSPAVRKLVQEHNLDASQIRGTGSGGRITHQDVMNYLESNKEQSTRSGTEGPRGRLQPHTPMRRTIANHMVMSMLQTAPHVTTVFEADLSAIVQHRERNKDAFEKQSTKLTLTAYFVKAAANALRAVPEVNSRWHDDALEIFEDINIGIATALDNSGLMVPVIQKVQDLDLFAVARVLQDLTHKTRKGLVGADHLKGGTFTITNHGVSGSLIATPIINQPQSAILGIGKLEKRVRVVEENGEEVALIRPMAYITLTIDHRVLDGYQANSFLSVFVKTLENWVD